MIRQIQGVHATAMKDIHNARVVVRSQLLRGLYGYPHEQVPRAALPHSATRSYPRPFQPQYVAEAPRIGKPSQATQAVSVPHKYQQERRRGIRVELQ